MPKSVDGDIRLSVNFDNNGIKKGVRSTESAISGLKTSLSKLGKAAVAALSVTAIVNFGKQAVELASDVQEVQNVVDTAFGEMAYKCEEFADSAIESFGMSKLSAKQTASTYMAMAKSMGISMDAASDMAIETAKLTGDVASFYNLDQATAATKLKGIFTGETEALKDLGVVMTEANLQEYALSRGIKTKYSAMSQSEKVMLRYEYVTNALSDASGDFVRTQDSWANQTRILSEQWKEFMSAIGSSLITVLTPLLQLLNNIVAVMVTFAQKTNELVTALTGSNAEEVKQSDNIATSVDNQNALTDAVNETADAQKKSLAGFDEINKISSGSADAAGTTDTGAETSLIGTAGSTDSTESSAWANSLAERIKNALSSVADWLKTTFEPTFAQAFNTIAPSFDGIKTAFSGIFADAQTLATPIAALFNNSVIPFIQQSILNISTIISGWISALGTILSGIWGTAVYPVLQTLINTAYPLMLNLFGRISDVVTQIIGILTPLIESVFVDGIMPALSILSSVFDSLWKCAAPIFAGFQLAIKNIGEMLSNVWHGLIKPVWDSIVSALTEIWENNLKPLWNNILDFVGELVICAQTIYNNVIAPIVKWVQTKIYPVIVKAVQAVVDRVKIVVQGIIDTVNGVITYWKGVIQFITGVFSGDWEKAWTGIQTAFKGIWDELVAIVKTPINLIIKMINKMLEGVIGGINSIVNAVNSLSIDAPGWVTDLTGIESFGFNLRTLNVPQIPLLAQGAVIPANKPFLSILGDQRNGTNVEAPLSTIEQAVENVISKMNISGGQNEAILYIGEEKFGRLIYKLNKRESKRVGVNFAEG